MKRMLINATQPEERRLAIVDGQKLMDSETEIEGREQRKSNIYKAVVTPGRALARGPASSDYGEDRHGFRRSRKSPRTTSARASTPAPPRIQDAIKEATSPLVQVEKEECATSGCRPSPPSRLARRTLSGADAEQPARRRRSPARIEGEDREELKKKPRPSSVPQGMSLIARTAAASAAPRPSCSGT